MIAIYVNKFMLFGLMSKEALVYIFDHFRVGCNIAFLWFKKRHYSKNIAIGRIKKSNKSIKINDYRAGKAANFSSSL